MTDQPTRAVKGKKGQPLPARFMSYVSKTETCWLWTGAQRKGYGVIRIAGKSVSAHRVAYEMLVGPIAEGMQIDHLCRQPLCVRPSHLEVVDSKTNTMRGYSPTALCARKTHCVHGHLFDEENTIIEKRQWARSVGYTRVCRECRRRLNRIAYARRKNAS